MPGIEPTNFQLDKGFVRSKISLWLLVTCAPTKKPLLEINKGRAKGILGEDFELKVAGADTVLVTFFCITTLPGDVRLGSDCGGTLGLLMVAPQDDNRSAHARANRLRFTNMCFW